MPSVREYVPTPPTPQWACPECGGVLRFNVGWYIRSAYSCKACGKQWDPVADPQPRKRSSWRTFFSLRAYKRLVEQVDYLSDVVDKIGITELEEYTEEKEKDNGKSG